MSELSGKKENTPLFRRLLWISGIGALALGSWLAMVPLEGAVISEAVFIPQGKRQVVRPPQGGVLGQLHIREGDVVEAGQILLRIEDPQIDARYTKLHMERAQLASRRARLEAEALGQSKIPGTALLQALREDPETKEIVLLELALFDQHLRSRAQIEALTETQIRQIDARQRGLALQHAALVERQSLLRDELDALMPIYKKGFVRRPRITQIQANIAALDGEMAALQAAQAQAKEQVIELRLALQSDALQRMEQARDALVQVQARQRDLQQELKVARVARDRLHVRAPAAGQIFNLELNTVGSAVPAGATLMEIVPSAAPLILEAKVRPEDIDALNIGQQAHVRGTAFNQRRTPPMKAQVVQVGGDAQTDPRTGRSHYVVSLRLQPSDEANHDLLPGMTAQVSILASARTPLQYLLAPVQGLSATAMRETD